MTNEFFDKDGNPVEGVYTKEQVDAMVEAAKAAAAPVATPATPTETPVPATPVVEEPPAWAKTVIEQVNTLTENTRRQYVDQVTAGLSAEDKAKLSENYNRLAGYDDTPEGIQARAQAAYLLTTGQQYTASHVHMGNMNAAGSGKVNINERPQATEADAFFGKMLGITDEDRAKYGVK